MPTSVVSEFSARDVWYCHAHKSMTTRIWVWGAKYKTQFIMQLVSVMQYLLCIIYVPLY